MSLADKASLLLIPTGYKSQKVYSIFPTDGVGDFDFSRSSSATRIAKNGLITTVAANVPRLEYPLIDGVVSGCPSLLLEPQRTNLLPYSEYVSSWSTTQATVTENYAISPEGVLNATRLVGTGTDFIRQDNIIANPSNKTFTSSFWAKNNGGDANISVQMNSSGVSTYAKGIALTNEWQRFDFTQSYAGTDTGSLTFRFRQTNSIDCLVYGFQLEEGSYPTSYIPTNGSAVTRLAETCNNSGDADTFNDLEGVLMAEIAKNKGNQYSLISLFKSSVSDTYIYIGYLDNTTTIRGQIKIDGTTVLDEQIEMADTNITAKVSVKYKSGDYSLYVNGLEVGSSSSTAIFTDGDLNEIQFGFANNSIFDFYGNIKQLQYFQTALTDSELEELTSWDSFKVMAIAQLYNIG